MITYNKLNHSESEILYNGFIIGYLSKHKSPAYIVELNGFKPLEFPASQKKLISGMIERLWNSERTRQKREFIKEHKLRNSIYNKGKQFKVLV